MARKKILGVRRGEVYHQLSRVKGLVRPPKEEREAYEKEYRRAMKGQRLKSIRARAREEARIELKTGKGRTIRRIEQVGRGAARWSGEFLGPGVVPRKRKKYQNPVTRVIG